MLSLGIECPQHSCNARRSRALPPGPNHTMHAKKVLASDPVVPVTCGMLSCIDEERKQCSHYRQQLTVHADSYCRVPHEELWHAAWFWMRSASVMHE